MTRNIPHLHRQVLRGLVILAAGLTLSGTPAAQATAPSWPIAEAPGELRAVVPRADLIVVSMHDAVLRELTDALSRGGPASAIGFCHLDATFLSQRIGKEEGIAAGRTSDRLRNPTNAPRPWAAPLVTANAGRQAKSVDGFVVDLGDRVGVLRPIAERPMCAGCHGPADKLSPGVLARPHRPLSARSSGRLQRRGDPRVVLGRNAEAPAMTAGPAVARCGDRSRGRLAWHALSIDAALAMARSTRAGLSEPEARARLQQYGPNRLAPATPASALGILRDQLTGVVVVLLLAAALVSLALGDRLEAAAIGIVLVINTVIGFTTEWRARRAMEALLELDVPRATVIRDGQLRVIDAHTLVPGDVIETSAGHRVPADARLLSTTDLRLTEAALTGESLPISKHADPVLADDAQLADRVNMLYKGTTVAVGTGRAVVVATGAGHGSGPHRHARRIDAGGAHTPRAQARLARPSSRLAHACGRRRCCRVGRRTGCTAWSRHRDRHRPGCRGRS